LIGDVGNSGVTLAGVSVVVNVPTAGIAITIQNSGSKALLTAPTSTFWDSSLFRFSFSPTRTVSIEDAPNGTSGGALYLVGGKNGASVQGGDVHILGGDVGGGTYGGSILIDGNSGLDFAHDGYVQIATLGTTNTVLIGNPGATSKLAFWKNTGVAQQSVGADTLDNLYTALRAYGLIA
jgi:hypothetical protein